MLKGLGCARGAAARARGKGKDESPVAGGKMRCGGGLGSCFCLSCKEEEFVQGQLLGLEMLLLLLG